MRSHVLQQCRRRRQHLLQARHRLDARVPLVPRGLHIREQFIEIDSAVAVGVRALKQANDTSLIEDVIETLAFRVRHEGALLVHLAQSVAIS